MSTTDDVRALIDAADELLTNLIDAGEYGPGIDGDENELPHDDDGAPWYGDTWKLRQALEPFVGTHPVPDTAKGTKTDAPATPTRTLKCVAACTNASGDPDFGFVVVQCTEEEYNIGRHYEAVEDYLAENDYERPFVVFDEAECPEWLLERFVWESASLIKVEHEPPTDPDDGCPLGSLDPEKMGD